MKKISFFLFLLLLSPAAAQQNSWHGSAAIGAANPIKWVDGGSILSPLFGLPANYFWQSLNCSADGSYTCSYQGTVHGYTYDWTSDHGTNFINPQGVPIYDDSTWYEYGAQNIAFVSKNQSVISGCNETTGFTVSGGQITAVSTVAPGCTGNVYTPNSTIKLQAYASPGFGTGCQFSAAVNASGAITSYSGLPCGSGMSAGNVALYFQSPGSVCSGGGCQYDVGPQLYLSRQTPTYWPKPGSILGAIYFSGPSNNGGAIGPQVSYGSIAQFVDDSTLANPKGSMCLGTASPATQNAGNTPRFCVSDRGFYANNAAGGAAGDGTVNAKGYFLDGVPLNATAGRPVLTGNRTYYVRNDGSDSNVGLTNTSGGAFASIQKALNTLAALDGASYAGTIQLGCSSNPCTFSGGNSATSPFIGFSSVSLKGDCTTPTNTTVSASGANAVQASNGAIINVSCLNLSTTTAGSLLQANNFGVIGVGANVIFGSAGYHHMIATQGGQIICVANYTISGGALAHIVSQQNGLVSCLNLTITLTGTPAFNAGYGFIVGTSLGNTIYYGNTFSGSATGPRFISRGNAVIDVNGATCNSYLPGNSNGTPSNGGQCG